MLPTCSKNLPTDSFARVCMRDPFPPSSNVYIPFFVFFILFLSLFLFVHNIILTLYFVCFHSLSYILFLFLHLFVYLLNLIFFFCLFFEHTIFIGSFYFCCFWFVNVSSLLIEFFCSFPFSPFSFSHLFLLCLSHISVNVIRTVMDGVQVIGPFKSLKRKTSRKNQAKKKYSPAKCCKASEQKKARPFC